MGNVCIHVSLASSTVTCDIVNQTQTKNVRQKNLRVNFLSSKDQF